jgi:hypothetical protein
LQEKFLKLKRKSERLGGKRNAEKDKIKQSLPFSRNCMTDKKSERGIVKICIKFILQKEAVAK